LFQIQSGGLWAKGSIPLFTKHRLRGCGNNRQTHIQVLKEKKLIPDYKTMTRKIYLQSEKALKEVAQGLGMSLAELDLYVFYLKTGKVLK
jgi:Thermostable 8-oxoguanine DNA glycosylase